MFLKSVALAALLSAPLYAQAPAPAKPAPAAEKLPDARTIIDRHVKAIGGREALLKHKSMHAVGTVAVTGSGVSGPIEIWVTTNPNRMLVKTTIPSVGEIMEGFDGSHGWSVNPMTGPTLKVDKELAQVKFDADLYSDLRDPKKYLEIKTVEKTTFDNRPCYKVSLKRPDGAEDFDFYDTTTGLRAGTITTRESMMGTMTTTSVEGGYKKMGDLLQATTSSQKVMGIEQILTISSVEYDNVAASVFDPPAAIKALIK